MKILDFPEIKQTFKYDCGACALESVFSYYGLDVFENEIIEVAKTVSGSGTSIYGMLHAVTHFGLKVDLKTLSIKELKKYINKKVPVILRIQAWTSKENVDWEKDWKDGHYVVAIGYDKEKIYFEDPWSIKRTFLSYEELEKRWHDIDIDGKKYCNYGIVIRGKRKGYDLNKAVHMD